MGMRKWWFIAIAFIGVALICVLTRRDKPEPQYQDKPASFWISVWDTPTEEGPDSMIKPLKMYSSREAFSAMGADGLEVLLRAMNSTNAMKRENATMLLGETGPFTSQVVNALVEASQTRESALHKLYRVSWNHLGGFLQKHLPIPDAPVPFSPIFFPNPDPWYLQ